MPAWNWPARARQSGSGKLRSRVSSIADRYYAFPSRSLNVTGITGTNGKTTCAYLMAQALERLGQRCALMGTTGNGFPGQIKTSELTTGDAITVQRELRQFVDCGATAVCMEISSHALCQDRVAAIDIDTAVFTNLSQDHLDYHQTLQAYAAAKKSLFEFASLKTLVVNGDDPVGQDICRSFVADASSRRLLTYGLGDADVSANRIQMEASGLRFDLCWKDRIHTISSPLIGRFNVLNLLAVVTALLANDYDLNEIVPIVPHLTPPPGRMEQLASPSAAPMVVVDYAHTPDSLEQALAAIAQHAAGRLWVVFGCGGDRDGGKRPLMGRVAASLADWIILTNDNPRSEPPQAILSQIAQGIEGIGDGKDRSYQVVEDRAAAIRYAIENADHNDWVLVAGKGHESTQTIGESKLPFNDREWVQTLFRREGGEK